MPITLQIKRTINDFNGNPTYLIFVQGLPPSQLPSLHFTKRVNRRIGAYTVQSHVGPNETLNEFKRTYLEKLEAIHNEQTDRTN